MLVKKLDKIDETRTCYSARGTFSFVIFAKFSILMKSIPAVIHR